MTARDVSMPARRASAAVLAVALAAALSACGGGGGGGGQAAATNGGPASQSFRPTIAASPRIAAMTASANLVTNPGFESGMTDWADWGNTQVIGGVGASGTGHALRAGTAAGGAGHDVAGLVGGTRYRLGAQAMVSGAGEVAYVGINILDAGSNVVAQQAVPVSTTTASLATLDITAPANAVKATVFLWKNAGSGYAYADDFTLAPADVALASGTPVASAANLVAEPGFENALSSWSNWGNASAAAGQGSSGAAALRVGTGAGGVGQDVTGVAPGTTYHLTGQVRVSDPSEVAFLGVAFLDAGGNKLQEQNVAVSATTYAAASVDALAPANTAKALVYVWKNAGAGYAYVDDVALAPAAAAAAASTPAASSTTATAAQSGAGVPTLGNCQLFPAAAIFNTRIDDTARFPRHAMSDTWTAIAGAALPLQTDWGVNDNPANWSTYWGLPINVIDSWDTQWPLVSFDFSASGLYSGQGYPFKSDCAVPNGAGGYGIQRDCTQVPASTTHFPFPVDGKLLNEGGQCSDPNSCGDHHVLVVEKGACRLWESYFSYKLNGQWDSMATAAWDLNSLALRPDNWASGDAAGLPMTPLLVKTAEANSGEIRHALRVDFRDAALALQHVWPARFAAGADNPGAIPFGALLRLRADFVIPANWTVQAKAIATAAKRYGMYVADNGGDFHIQGEPNAGWDPATSQQLKSIALQNMEFVDLRAITSDPRFDPNSMAASW